MAFPSVMGSWTLDGKSMIWAGAEPQDLEQLWLPAPLLHDNVEQSGVQGRLARMPVEDEAVYDIHYLLSGFVMADGSPASSTFEGFRSNYKQLAERVGTPDQDASPSTARWTGEGRTSIVTPFGEASKTALVQPTISSFDRAAGKAGGSHLPVTVTVVVPRGKHT